MSSQEVLLIEDEEGVAEIIRYNLTREGYRVTWVNNGEDGLKKAHDILPQLILLDLMLPGVDGFEVCRVLKSDRATRNIPIIIVSAKNEDADVVVGLELGADDFVTKPFSPRVLMARVKAAFRRDSESEKEFDELIRFDEIAIDLRKRQVSVENKPVKLTKTEFQILVTLARRNGWVFTRNQIINEIHGNNMIVTDRSVDVQIAGLRKKLGNVGHYIETVHGIGYRFINPEEEP